MEQFKLQNCMEVKGLKENDIKEVTDLKKFAVQLLRKLNVTCDPNQIVKAYAQTIKDGQSTLPLINIWFSNEEEKVRIMTEKAQYEINHNLKSGIFFNHALTRYNRALLNKALSIRHRVNLPIVVVRNGKINMKRDKKSKPKIIRTFEDIDELLEKQDERVV